MVKKLFIIVLLLCCLLSVANSTSLPVVAQGAQPDGAQWSAITAPNVLTIEVIQTRPTESGDGIEVDFTVGNPLNTLYLPFSFELVGDIEPPELLSEDDWAWAALGLIPPKNLFSFSPRTITFRVRFISMEQFLRVRSSALDIGGLLFNATEIAMNHFLPRVGKDRIAAAMVATGWSVSTTAVANLNCLSSDSSSIDETRDCLLAFVDLLGTNPAIGDSFRDFLVSVLQVIAPDQVGRSSVDLFIDTRDLFERISNFTDLMISSVLYAGARQPYNLYHISPTTSVDYVAWPPTLNYPIGLVSETQPRFTWNGLSDVTYYELQVDQGTGFESPLIIEREIEETAFTPLISLEPNTEYQWRVRSYYSQISGWSSWSTGAFTTGFQQGITELEEITIDNVSQLRLLNQIPVGDFSARANIADIVAWSWDGTRIAIVNTQGISVIDITDLTSPPIVLEGSFRSVVFGTDGSLVAGSRNNTLYRWVDLNEQPIIAQPNLSRFGSYDFLDICDLSLSPNNQTLAIGYCDFTVSAIYDIVTRQTEAVFYLNGENVAISVDGTMLALGDHRGVILVRELTGSPFSIGISTGWVSDLTFSPNGQWLASANGDAVVIMWNLSLPSWKIFETQGGALSPIFTPNGRVLIAHDTGATIYAWDVETEQELHRINDGGWAVQINSSGTLLASVNLADNVLNLWGITANNQP